MALENKIEVHTLNFKHPYRECRFPDKKDLGTVLKAKWTMCACFYRPLGFKLNLRSSRKFQLHSSRAGIEIKCTGLERQVFVEGIIRVEILHADKKSKMQELSFGEEEEFQHLFDPKDNRCGVYLKMGNLSRNDALSSVTFEGDMKFYVNPENYFYFNFTDDIFQTESELQNNHAQILKEMTGNLEGLFRKRYFSDVELHCGSEVFPAHKAILSSRSPVFEAMFQTPMKETEEKVVNIEDIEPDTVEAMLKYLYCGKIVNLCESTAYDLLAAADKYELPGLRSACICFLRSRMSVDNAVRTFAFAHLYDADLKKVTLNFICKEFVHIKTTPEWKRFQKEETFLANEVLLNIIEFIGSR